MQNQINEKEKETRTLLSENLDLKSLTEQFGKDLDMYKETLKRLYVVYVEQQKLVEVHYFFKTYYILFLGSESK